MTPWVVTRPIRLPAPSVNQRLPSGPAAMPSGWLPAVGTENSVTAPAVVIRPIRSPSYSVNQRFPSGPAAIPPGLTSGVGRGNSVTTPAVVIRPIRLPKDSVNQRLPSGPAVIRAGKLAVGTENSVTTPAVVIRPILLSRPLDSVNQRLPSGPAVMPPRSVLVVGNRKLGDCLRGELPRQSDVRECSRDPDSMAHPISSAHGHVLNAAVSWTGSNGDAEVVVLHDDGAVLHVGVGQIHLHVGQARGEDPDRVEWIRAEGQDLRDDFDVGRVEEPEVAGVRGDRPWRAPRPSVRPGSRNRP